MYFLFSAISNDGICHNDQDMSQNAIVFETAYRLIDFKDIISSPNPRSRVIVKINTIKYKSKIKHTLPNVNRCCHIDPSEKVHYDGVDKMRRDNCDISKSNFFDKYVQRREPVILAGCQRTWHARNWTFGGNGTFLRLVFG